MNYKDEWLTNREVASHVKNAKFTVFQVRTIRNSSKTLIQLAEEYDVSKMTIYRIKVRQSYKHVD